MKIKQNYFLRLLKLHPRLFISILFSFLIYLICPYFGLNAGASKALVGYNFGVVFYISWAAFLISKSNTERIRKIALQQDDGKFVVLLLVVLALVFSMSAIFMNLASVKNYALAEKQEHIILALSTIVLSWFFTHLVFAIHYAHDYYYDLQHPTKSGGLVFLPENEDPDYLDFIYFSFILGATAQTADITLASKKMRRTCLLHSILSFFFNAAVLALTINIASGLL